MKLTSFICIVAILLVCTMPCGVWGEGNRWTTLDDGLFLGKFAAPAAQGAGEDAIVILKIDPRHYRLRLLAASEYGRTNRSTRQWCREFDLAAAVNAGMYATDYLTSTGYMRNGTHVNNSFVNPRFGAFLAFNPKSPDVPPVQIVDRQHQDWKSLIEKYDTVVQNYRFITLAGENAWTKKENERMTSHTIVAADRAGYVLFIFGNSSLTAHALGESLLALSLDIRNAMYVEGGSEASLCLNHGDAVREWAGSGEVTQAEPDGERYRVAIPNVIGIQKIK